MLDEILKALDRIPVWKRLGEVPDEVDDLKQRVAKLEEMLGGRWPPDVCKACGARALRMTFSAPDKNKKIRQDWACGECHHNEVRYG